MKIQCGKSQRCEWLDDGSSILNWKSDDPSFIHDFLQMIMMSMIIEIRMMLVMFTSLIPSRLLNHSSGIKNGKFAILGWLMMVSRCWTASDVEWWMLILIFVRSRILLLHAVHCQACSPIVLLAVLQLDVMPFFAVSLHAACSLITIDQSEEEGSNKTAPLPMK